LLLSLTESVPPPPGPMMAPMSNGDFINW
jgi:hypothetical protein